MTTTATSAALNVPPRSERDALRRIYDRRAVTITQNAIHLGAARLARLWAANPECTSRALNKAAARNSITWARTMRLMGAMGARLP